MDYKKMWYMMKENLLRESQRRELGTIRMDAADQHLKMMEDIEIKAVKESQHVCECGGEKAHCNPKPEKETGNKREPWGKSASGKCKDTDKLERAAREKNISIAHVHYGAFRVGAGIPFPFPFPPEFLK